MLVIDGNSVFEIDEECIKKRQVSPKCGIPEEWLPHIPANGKTVVPDEKKKNKK